MKKFAHIGFLVVALATIFEYLMVFGMFTGPIMLALVTIFGLINLVLSLKHRNYNEAIMYLIATVALSMGYWKVMF